MRSLHKLLNVDTIMLGLIQNAHRSLSSSLAITSIRNCFSRVQCWLNNLEPKDTTSAHFLCRVIPAQCPFETEVVLFNQKIAHIPPLCKLNPFYKEVINLRFRALCYLAEHGEDISFYC